MIKIFNVSLVLLHIFIQQIDFFFNVTEISIVEL